MPYPGRVTPAVYGLASWALDDGECDATGAGMPLTALRADGSLVDATACTDAEWAGVHKTSPRAVLTCRGRGCGGGLHAKVSKLGFRFFAHDVKRDDCPTNGETPEHRELKALLAAAIREAGGTAVVEAYPEAAGIGGWRAGGRPGRASGGVRGAVGRDDGG